MKTGDNTKDSPLGDLQQELWILGLDRVRQALERLQTPQKAYAQILVAGTNGKGSTCIYLEGLLKKKGLRVGTTISPHVNRFTERFRIDGREVDAGELAALRSELEVSLGGLGLTYFEWCVVLAAELFRRHDVDYGIFEIGLGGRLDAANVLDPVLSIITDIALDHRAYLGDTLEAIACEKAAIARAGRPLITSARGAALHAIRSHAAEVGALLEVVHTPLAFETGILGPHQALNAALADRACRALGVELGEADLAAALRAAFLPGRVERVGERFILDVAHNPASMLDLTGYLRQVRFAGAGVLGILADKEYLEMTRMLLEVCDEVFIAPLNTPRSWGPEQMKPCLALGRVHRCSSIKAAFARASRHNEGVVVTGSFYTVGEVRGLLI